MGAVLEPTAWEISVSEVLALLNGRLSAFSAGVGRAQYAFWIGSGVSRDQVDDLKSVIARVLRFLQARVDDSSGTCKYRRALSEALDYAGLSPDQKASFQLEDALDSWPVKNVVLDRLAEKYSKLLDIRIEGMPPDYLLWDAVDVPATFATSVGKPDCEHLCLAILGVEGLAPDVASANWDGLIEAAVAKVTGNPDTYLRVCVLGADLQQTRLPMRLLKFHGCAVRAALDPATYRPLLIARYSQITNWRDEPAYAMMRLELVRLCAASPTLMIGMSAQDVNIQGVFSEARANMHWPWPHDPPAHIFAEESVGVDQLNILRMVFGADFDSHDSEITAASHVRSYAKQLLLGLTLQSLASKLCTYARMASAPGLGPAEWAALCSGIERLRDRLGAAADPDRLAFIEGFIGVDGALMRQFREGALQPVGGDTYRALGNLPTHLIATDPGLTTNGMRELAVILGLFGLGESRGLWAIEGVEWTSSGACTVSVTSALGRTGVMLAANTSAGVNLEMNSLHDSSDADSVLVYSLSPAARMARAPGAAIGRIGRAGARTVGMSAILQTATDLDDLLEAFRLEAIL